MRRLFAICLIVGSALFQEVRAQKHTDTSVDFFGVQVSFAVDPAIIHYVPLSLSENGLDSICKAVLNTSYQPIVDALLLYRTQYKPDDWLYYQLIRKTAEALSPKHKDYHRYTFFKWFLLTRSGFDATITISDKKMLFYVRCDENIYNIPSRLVDGRQYVCLNYHDYRKVDFNAETFNEVKLPGQGSQRFSYEINKLPEFRSSAYLEKELQFYYYETPHQLKIRLNPEVNAIFTNYPVVDYKYSLNIPLSKETYQSLIPLLKKQLAPLNPKNGVDYLRRFTRDAFMFETDTRMFGGEKRLSPEETLLSPQSDCEDRVALFYCLVKEIYNLPMIVLAYPDHVTIAVQFDKAVGKPIMYNGNKYTVCEPTPQKHELRLGKLLPGLEHQDYKIAYVYTPGNK